MADNHRLPSTDIFTYTVPSHIWTDHEYLTEILMWLVYNSAGTVGIAIAFGVITWLGFWLMYRQVRRQPFVIVGVGLALAAVAGDPIWGPRAQMITFALTCLELYWLQAYLSGRSRMLLYFPLVMALWANLHGGWVIGFVWLGMFEPSPEELGRIQELFGLHELAVEDAQSFHLRPKVEQYDEGIQFVVLRTARYVDDVELPSMLHAAFVRSPLPHARIVAIDVAHARALPGVTLVLTGEDLRDDAPVLVVAEGRRLAGGPAGDEAVGSVARVELDELAHLRLVDLAVAEGSDHRDERTLEPRTHRAVSPATRSSYVSRRRTIV